MTGSPFIKNSRTVHFSSTGIMTRCNFPFCPCATTPRSSFAQNKSIEPCTKVSALEHTDQEVALHEILEHCGSGLENTSSICLQEREREGSEKQRHLKEISFFEASLWTQKLHQFRYGGHVWVAGSWVGTRTAGTGGLAARRCNAWGRYRLWAGSCQPSSSRQLTWQCHVKPLLRVRYYDELLSSIYAIFWDEQGGNHGEPVFTTISLEFPHSSRLPWLPRHQDSCGHSFPVMFGDWLRLTQLTPVF